jgi:hypothetical protein
MGRLIAVIALAGAAVVAAHPSSSSRAHVTAAPAPVAAVTVAAHTHTSDEAVLAAAEQDLAGRQAELGLVGAAPLFGAEGLPKPSAVR